jgi:hypothetical protein
MISIALLGDVRLNPEGLAALLSRDGRVQVAAATPTAEGIPRAASAVDVIVVDTAADAESQAVRDVVDTSVSTRNDPSKFVGPWWWGSPLRGMGVFGELAPAG